VSQGLWKQYRRGFKPLAGLTKPGRSQRRDQTKPSTWSSRLGVGLTIPLRKNKPVTRRGEPERFNLDAREIYECVCLEILINKPRIQFLNTTSYEFF